MWWCFGEQGITMWQGIFGRAERRWHERGRGRAMHDARYREIQQRIGTPDGGVVLDDDEDFDLWEEQADIFSRINPHPLHVRFKWWWDRVGRVPRRQRALVQRARRGWAEQDVWQLDRYLAGVMAGAVRHLAATGHGAPHDLEDDEWRQTLDEIAGGFEDYSHAAETSDHYDEQTLAKLRRSLDLMSQYWTDLWD